MTQTKRMRLVIIGGLIFVILTSLVVYAITRQNTPANSEQNDTSQDSEEEIDGHDDEGEPLPEDQISIMENTGVRAAQAYFTYSPFESPTARKARLQTLFTADSPILQGSELPPFAGPSTISARISEETLAPIARNQDSKDANVRVTVELIERNANGDYLGSETSKWLVLMRGSDLSWRPYNILPVDSPELTPIEKDRD